MPPGRFTSKLHAQPHETWAMFQKRLIEIPFDYTEILSTEVAEFIELKATASHTCLGYTVVSLIAVAAFLISLGSSIETSPGMIIKPNLFSIIIGPPTTGKSQALKITALSTLAPLEPEEDDDVLKFLLEKVSPSGLSTFLAKHQRCLILSTELSDVFNNLLKTNADDAKFSVSTLCQLFSGEKITLDFATQARRTIPADTPFAILGGIQLKPLMLLAHTLAEQGSGLLDRMLICSPKCLPPSMTEAAAATASLATKDYPTEFITSMAAIHTAHTNPDDIKQYTFSEEAQEHLNNIHETFNNTLRDCIREGRPPPISKNIELISRTAAALFVLNNILVNQIHGQDFAFPTIISLQAVERAEIYVRYCETQKEAIVKMLSEITAACYDKPTEQPTIQDVQVGIITCPGPVVTYRSFTKSTPRLRLITKQEYSNAVEDMRKTDFGTTAQTRIPRATRPTKFYIKGSPDQNSYNKIAELELALTPVQYELRYNQPAPAAITQHMKDYLIKANLVPAAALQDNGTP